MQKKLISFEALLQREYDMDTEMFMLNWFLKTGEAYNTHSQGVDKLLFGYSANNFNSYHPIPFPNTKVPNYGHSLEVYVYEIFMQSVFFNAILKNTGDYADQWRKAERITLDSRRYFNMPSSGLCRDEKTYPLYELGRFDGKAMKKQYAQPQYDNRINPIICQTKLSTVGKGYLFSYSYNFEGIRNSIWTEHIKQAENQNFSDFAQMVMVTMNRMTEKSV